MFKCGKCGESSKSGQTVIKRVTEFRIKVYRDLKDRPCGRGWETVKDLNLCLSCSDLMGSFVPPVVEKFEKRVDKRDSDFKRRGRHRDRDRDFDDIHDHDFY